MADKTILADFFDCSPAALKNTARLQKDFFSSLPGKPEFFTEILPEGNIRLTALEAGYVMIFQTALSSQTATADCRLSQDQPEAAVFQTLKQIKRAVFARTYFTTEIKRGLNPSTY